jgi:hypothetical protein
VPPFSSSSSPHAFLAPQQKFPEVAINLKNHGEAMISGEPVITFLCTCGRNAALGSPQLEH